MSRIKNKDKACTFLLSLQLHCLSTMNEVGYFTLLMRKILALFDSSYDTVPFTCLLHEALDFPLMILIRIVFAYTCTLVATLLVIFLEWIVIRASHECTCLP
ncbi:unnamed protein product [Mytilus coruscus]|uniref:Uncharacterized protein n=1 Tax=Mytilus coruscus TaxID=42192 RepID=A0A6J8ANB1_MYTCO|nr:unnamed protein product [Mytilus coruscus]